MPSLGSVARVIRTPETPRKGDAFKSDKSAMKKLDMSGIISAIAPKSSNSAEAGTPGDTAQLHQDQFLTLEELINPESNLIKKARKRSLDDIFEMMRNNQWENIIALYHPVEEKAPDLVASEADLPIREKVAFALGQLNRFDEAIDQLTICISREPDNFHTRSSLGYTAYNSLFANKNREIMLTPQMKAERIAIAHENFRKAEELRPETVTCYYRHGMLCSKIEDKPEIALPLFRKACENWEMMDENQQTAHHQEKKNYIKSLYRLGSILLAEGDPNAALERINTCLELDKDKNHISLTFKYFALGKIHFHLGNHIKAKEALVFALQSSKGKADDFVVELLARTLLALKNPAKALEVMQNVPEHLRRPYFRWTESDVLCALHRFRDAEQVLKASTEKDMRSKHKTLIRLAKICYLQHKFADAAANAEAAFNFFQRQWGNPYSDGLFWQALANLRMNRPKKAETLALELQENCCNYPKLDLLMANIKMQKE
ncbi:TPR repeat-containing protein [Desulfamplus magnetovallimortis]|uniref:TPR repeat-containing protein n=1 Tax=Desulfamplus magnetovallimortis TaxID=1246637 RepID=A0A1W1H7M2_9BACT|nr:hypothetical protein [Desulfamplus magnetovallimortis]SLM28434.1 TPR repeat-containing protein [Desulfamplus magnetovallimortis]